jgi:hypothetical protein
MNTIMSKFITTFILILYFSLTASAKDKRSLITTNDNEPVLIKPVASLMLLLKSTTAAKAVLGFSKEGRSVEAYYFPGTSSKRALVIGGVHGSELSSIEVADSLIEYLKKGTQKYYSVIVIPSLFPDNAAAAKNKPEFIGSSMNYGRYTCNDAVDPNRQMPSLGKSFNEDAKDHLGREIETENRLLLDLINLYQPQRIVNIHAIRDTTKAGIYADPRTDANGMALGYESDSSLAVEMTKYIYNNDGYIPGNHMDSVPSSLYHCDPPAAKAGCLQQRNLKGSRLPNQRGTGVSLGGWASTAIYDPINPAYNRDAIRILTMEFPGYKRSSDYATANEQTVIAKLTEVYAASIQMIFLEKYFEE